MAFTTFSGPIRVGTVRGGAGRNTGLVVLNQTYDSGDLTGRTVGNYDVAAFIIPRGAFIRSIAIDQITAATAGTTTVSVGNASGGAQLGPATATTAGGRFTPALTAATQTAWYNSAASGDATVFIRLAVGTATLTAGRFIVTMDYVQRNDDGAANPVRG